MSQTPTSKPGEAAKASTSTVPNNTSPPPKKKEWVYNPSPPPLPLWKYVVAGGTAGVAEILAMYPIDVV